MSRTALFRMIMVALIVCVPVVFVEVAVRLLNPQPMMYPRYQHSERFGHMLPESATIVEEVPGEWRFVYRTSEFGFRAPFMGVSNCYEQPNIVFLGDSNTFGFGVNDGEEYPAVLARELAAQAGMVNLSMGSFGLTHQIRAFYEFGVVYRPSVVVLQFAENDPDDNLFEMVTVLENGRFRFVPDTSMQGTAARLKSWLSQSILQRSAAYNFVRNYAYAFWRARVLEQTSVQDQTGKERLHISLLTAFAEDLRNRGITLYLIDVPGHLDAWPVIRSAAETLDRQGLVRYISTNPLFEGVDEYGTPEGHAWGAKGHRIVAEHLRDVLKGAVLERLPQWDAGCSERPLPP